MASIEMDVHRTEVKLTPLRRPTDSTRLEISVEEHKDYDGDGVTSFATLRVDPDDAIRLVEQIAAILHGKTEKQVLDEAVKLADGDPSHWEISPHGVEGKR